MRGLRTQESNEFGRFFTVVQHAAEELNCVFFLDCGEGNDCNIGDMQGEELSGWLIPQSRAKSFGIEWLKCSESERWNEFYTFAIWHTDNGVLSIEFNNYK